LQFLNLQDASGRKLGDGLAPEWAIPVGAALTAAEFTMTPHDRASLNNWPLVAGSFRWVRPCREGEKLISVSRIEALGRTSVTQALRVYSYETRDMILQGKSVSVSAGPLGPTPFIATFFGRDESEPAPDSVPPAQQGPIAVHQSPGDEQPLSDHSLIIQAVITKPKARSLDGKILSFPLQIEEQGLTLSSFQPVRVFVQAPAFIKPEEIRRLVIQEKGKPIAAIEPDEKGLAQIEFLACGCDGYEMVIHLSQAQTESLCPDSFAEFWSTVEALYEESPEDERPELFRLEGPRLTRKTTGEPNRLAHGDEWEWIFPADLLRLLMNPLAGGPAPLGRRAHPIAAMQLGTAVYAAL
jgi:hypothetical protein